MTLCQPKWDNLHHITHSPILTDEELFSPRGYSPAGREETAAITSRKHIHYVAEEEIVKRRESFYSPRLLLMTTRV